MQTPTATRSGKSRIEWMDALRGLAIVLVVYDHALRFTIEYAGQAPAVLTFISDTFNPLRMPTMVFLSGMLLSASLSKGPVKYVMGKIRNILYPYLLWSAIYITLFIAAQPITGGEHSWQEYGEIFYYPPGHLWFLYYLFFYYLLMLALQRVPRLVIAGGSLVLAVVTADVPLLPRFWFLFAFFALGDLAARRHEALSSLLRSPSAVIPSLVLALGLPVAAWQYGNLRYELPSVPLVVGGIVVFILLAEATSRTRASAPLCFIGRNSLTIYILHWMLIAMTMVVLRRVMPPGSEALMVALAFLAGLSGAVVAVWVIRRLHLSWLFALPLPADRRRLAPAE